MTSPLAPSVLAWPRGERTVLYHPLTGRHIDVGTDSLEALTTRPGDPLLRPFADRLAREHMLAEGPQPDPSSLIPVRSRLVLGLLHGALLWAPDPHRPGPGGHSYRGVELSPAEHQLWREVNDARTVRAIAERAGRPCHEAIEFFAHLTAPGMQVVQLRSRPLSRPDPSLERLAGPRRPDNLRTEGQYTADGRTSLLDYHLHHITDASQQFNDRETTVAHAMAPPHAGLGGQPYGAALRESLAHRGLLPSSGVIAEVGCGTGELARDFAGEGLGPAYVRVDLSPALLRAQAQKAPHTYGVLGDATRLPLRDHSVDLLICNEVIADLESSPLPANDPTLERFAVRSRGDGAIYNTGTWAFIEEVARVLRPGGAACITEFGEPDEAPQEARQLDHPEISIHFGELAHVARQRGLRCELVRLDVLLRVDLHAAQLSRASWRALRAYADSRDHPLRARAWGPEALEDELPWPVHGLHWTTLADEGPGPLITRFWAALLRA